MTTDEEWKQQLTPEQYRVLREKGTEAPFSGQFLKHDRSGTYTCAGCGTPLFRSDAKFESSLPGLVGWPSFAETINQGAIELRDDASLGMQRTEVVCKTCGGHLGHLFHDPTASTGNHYCINSCALGFSAEASEKDGAHAN